jgi:muramoyltetrapeptide carboxypeptidase
MGLIPVWTDRVFQREGYLAGPDALRIREFVAAMTTDTAGGVVTARGGYGAMRILDEVAAQAPGFRTCLFMGFSDVTAIHSLLLDRAGLGSFHGPNMLGMNRLDDESRLRLGNALMGIAWKETFAWDGLGRVHGGTARGRVIAGNLTMVAALCGTRHELPLDGTLLVLEDVNEPAYRVDRMLTQILLHREASGLAGVVLGDLGVSAEEQGLLESAVHRFAEVLGRPVVTGFPAGHGAVNHPIPQGVEALLDADGGTLRIVEDPYDRGAQ